MPAPSPTPTPLPSELLERIRESAVTRMPSPVLPWTVQYSTVVAEELAWMPMPVVGVRVPAVLAVLLTTQRETMLSVATAMPAEMGFVLVLAREVQSITLVALLPLMPNWPLLDSALQ